MSTLNGRLAGFAVVFFVVVLAVLIAGTPTETTVPRIVVLTLIIDGIATFIYAVLEGSQ